VHIEAVHGDDEEAGTGTMTIEGFMRGRRPVAGHYLLDRPKVMQSATESTAINAAEVPAGRVIFVEVLKVDGRP